MKVLAILWTVCLVGLCHCGGDNGGAKGGVKGGEKQNQPQENAQPAGRVDIILDLANPDKDKVNIETKEVSGVEHTTYTSKSVPVTLVVGEETRLWATPEGEKLLLARVSKKNESSLLLISAKTHGRVGKKYFEKNGNGEWKKITEENYDKKLEDLKNEPTKKSAKANDQSEDSPNIPPQSEAPPSELPGAKKKNSKK
ncbi:signal peptide containing protein [Theileria equi strain WA]|uniref:Signal peptide containing protein n=1 Tax=Theileria equi strain WA TaxID=1537102 RepID=L1LEQ4_THEEQ|nr:signal peptide containing protein [Theileria equi strain WA]EKX73811.1 signal peptide containing protein [Theileria equi strain WA]|eukprot:XP_004833263.1 signal peptide containing protein [Theileria equi strain WA]